MHALEKILARAAGKNEVRAGEIVMCRVDLAEVNDLYLLVIKSFEEMGGKKVWDPERVAFVFDHYAPAPTIKSAENHKIMREFICKHEIRYHFDINEGVCHQVMPESGLVFPGMILVATDSHATTHGAFGAFGTGVGSTDLACILISGELWFRVPEVIKIDIGGCPMPGVLSKDIILHILGTLGTDAAIYKAIEFCGDTIRNFDIASRMVLCNMSVEMGAKTSYIQPDGTTLSYIEKSGIDINGIEVFKTDPGYVYDKTYSFDVSKLQPQVAMPHSVDNVVPVGELKGTKVDQVFIGSCTGGRIEDIEWVYKILKNEKVYNRTRLIIIPASKRVYLEAIKRGYVETLIRAGATFSAPGCGPCIGTHQGVIAPGEVCVTDTNRNFPGRMGSNRAEIYLASPATAAACALAGEIVNPMEYI